MNSFVNITVCNSKMCGFNTKSCLFIQFNQIFILPNFQQHNRINMCNRPEIGKFMRPTWGPPGSYRPQMGPMLAPWTLLSEAAFFFWYTGVSTKWLIFFSSYFQINFHDRNSLYFIHISKFVLNSLTISIGMTWPEHMTIHSVICSLITNQTHKNIFLWHLIRNSNIFLYEKANENVCKKLAI